MLIEMIRRSLCASRHRTRARTRTHAGTRRGARTGPAQRGPMSGLIDTELGGAEVRQGSWSSGETHTDINPGESSVSHDLQKSL